MIECTKCHWNGYTGELVCSDADAESSNPTTQNISNLCPQCQGSEFEDSDDEPEAEANNPQRESALPLATLLACVASLERDMQDAEKKVDESVAREAYGDAEYHRGRTHAYALASLRVKRIIPQANAIGEARADSQRMEQKTEEGQAMNTPTPPQQAEPGSLHPAGSAHVWIVEMMHDNKTWHPTVGCRLSKADGRTELAAWKQRNPCDRFRLTRYAPNSPLGQTQQ